MDVKKTPLYTCHIDAGARMVEYAGWDMPVQYAGIAEETAAVRQKSGLFDVSHMGEILVTGEDAGRFMDWILTRPVSGKKIDQVTYCLFPNPEGGTVDDLLAYAFEPNHYFLVVNAANKDKDVKHVKDSVARFQKAFDLPSVDVTVTDVSDQYGQIAWQGPQVREVAGDVLPRIGFCADNTAAIMALKRFRRHIIADPQGGVPWVVSRTGYTGEDGFEIYLPAAATATLWTALIDQGIAPCGLGARDVLRLEAALPLYGHELSETISPLDAGLSPFVDLNHPFQGDVMKDKVSRRVLHLVSRSKAIPREGYDVIVEGHTVGTVASGTFSPTLGKGIATVFVDKNFALDGRDIAIRIRAKDAPFEPIEPPFVG